MLLKMYSVFDSKADAFLPPFFLHNNGLALRTFGDACNMKDHQFGKHPEDYTLFELGVFEDDSGSFEIYKTPKSLGLGVEFVVREVEGEIMPKTELKAIEGGK